jgi:acyl-CoA thioesterase superfamily protein/acyl-Coa thioesterase superfamily protein
MTEPLFEYADGAYHPAPYTRSPWSAESLHGGAPAALMVGAIEAHEPPETPMSVVRVTADLVRPVPVRPLVVTTETIRPGRRVSVIAATLRADGEVCLRMTALRLRDADIAPPPDTPQPDDRPPVMPDDALPYEVPWPFDAFHTHGCEVRGAGGSWLELGAAFVWIRLRYPVTAGAEPSPMQRVVAASDFANGVSCVLPFTDWLFVNPDLTVHVTRPAYGEWIALDAVTLLGDRGSGMSTTALYDVRGRLGSTAQSLLVEPR